MIKPPPFTTQIGRYKVPVLVNGVQTIERFRDGYYAFWTAVLKKSVDKRWRVIGRAKVGYSAGDRFDRMKRECRAGWIPKEDRPEYKNMWEMMGHGANIKYIRSSTKAELRRWMDSHPKQREERC